MFLKKGMHSSCVLRGLAVKGRLRFIRNSPSMDSAGPGPPAEFKINQQGPGRLWKSTTKGPGLAANWLFFQAGAGSEHPFSDPLTENLFQSLAPAPNPKPAGAPEPMTESSSLRQSLEAIVGPDRVLDRPVERVAFAADAGFYRLIPKAVVFARSVAEVQALFRFSRAVRDAHDLPGGRHQPVRPGHQRRHPGGSGPPLADDRGAGRRRPGQGPAGRHRRPREPGAAPVPGQDRARTRPPSPPAPWAASSPTTPAACAAGWSRTPTTPWIRSPSCCLRAPSSTPPRPDADERFRARGAGPGPGPARAEGARSRANAGPAPRGSAPSTG